MKTDNDPGGYGLRVTITARDGTKVFVGHLSGVVGFAQRVNYVLEGEPFAYSGNSGNASNMRGDQEHVHLHVSMGGEELDPLGYIRGHLLTPDFQSMGQSFVESLIGGEENDDLNPNKHFQHMEQYIQAAEKDDK